MSVASFKVEFVEKFNSGKFLPPKFFAYVQYNFGHSNKIPSNGINLLAQLNVTVHFDAILYPNGVHLNSTPKKKKEESGVGR